MFIFVVSLFCCQQNDNFFHYNYFCLITVRSWHAGTKLKHAYQAGQLYNSDYNVRVLRGAIL